MTIIALFTSYKDYFTWEYIEMPSLNKDLVESYLPIKPGFRPFQHPLRRMALKVVA